MLVARQGRRRKSGRARLTSAPSASSMHSQACHYSSRFGAPETQSHRPSSLPPRTLLHSVRLLKSPRYTQLDAASAVPRALLLFPSSRLSRACACARACFPRCVPDATRTTRSRVACLACSACALALPGACPLSRRPFPRSLDHARPPPAQRLALWAAPACSRQGCRRVLQPARGSHDAAVVRLLCWGELRRW